MNFILAWFRQKILILLVRSISEKRIPATLTESPISDEHAFELVRKIKALGWWQGSVINATDLPNSDYEEEDILYWIIISQTCNIYNASFEKVPVFELVAARSIEESQRKQTKGDHPRILHVDASSDASLLHLEIDIQHRLWLPRKLLAQLPPSALRVKDIPENVSWLDNLAGWIARSYTRVALPDAFNAALSSSKLKEVLEKKLIQHKDDLYGIYVSLECDSDTDIVWQGALGEMPSPYNFSIILVTKENVDPELLRKKLITQIFVEKVNDPSDSSKKITRADLARRYEVRIIEEGIHAKTVAEFSVKELQSLVRYSFVDHLSNSSMAA